ncbi:MAG: DUF760 domain-containing protein [Prochlorotrichaceae cyanobacterium]
MNTDFKTSPNFFNDDSAPSLVSYVQAMNPDLVAQLSKPQSQEVLQVMEHNIAGLLGNLPADHFNIVVTTNKENLGRLLASAMVSGYFLRNAELRHSFERSLGEASVEGVDQAQD